MIFNEYGQVVSKDVHDTSFQIDELTRGLFKRLLDNGASHVDIRAVTEYLNGSLSTVSAAVRILDNMNKRKIVKGK